MLQSVPVIKEDTRKSLNRDISEHLKANEGSDLDSAVQELLNDKEAFTFLAAFLPKGKGLQLGKFGYWDDVQVEVYWGLMFDSDTTPRRVKIYTYENYGVKEFDHFRIGGNIPRCPDTKGNMTPEEFAEHANRVLLNFKDYLVDIPLDKVTTIGESKRTS